jgi:uncharacterized MAPEG superfamily protein
MMSTELSSLVWITTFTALLWAPYVLNRMVVGGIQATVGYPAEPPELSPWARRLRAAHANAVENLVVFAALILSAQAVGVSTKLTAAAATLFLWSRIVHAVTYTLGMSWIRTLAFIGGFAAQLMIATQLLVG